MLLRLLHGSVLLPCGIPGKMIIPLDTFTTIAMLSCLDAIVTCRATHLLCQPLLVAMKPLTCDTIPANRCLAMLPACSAPLIALLVAGEDEDCSMLGLVVGISQYVLNILTHPYTWQWVEGLAFCSVFCSTHATLGADKSALCSLILRSLHGWVYGDPLTLRL